MADYVEILDTQIEPDAPLTAVLAGQWRDNCIAIAEGASGAPRIQTAAIQNSAVTSAKLANSNSERDWVLARTAGAAAGAVGTYAFLGRVTDDTNLFGSTLAGSNLFPAGLRSSDPFNGSAPNATSFVGQNSARAGTWRCMGSAFGAVGGGGATLWLRIS